MILTADTKLMSYRRIEIPKYMRTEMQLKTGSKTLLYFENDHVTLFDPELD